MADNFTTLIETADVKVRIMPLEPGGSTPWHHHTEIPDRMVCLEGKISVECRGPLEVFILKAGEMCEVPVGRQHRVRNATALSARYLLIQGVGRYDFIVADAP